MTSMLFETLFLTAKSSGLWAHHKALWSLDKTNFQKNADGSSIGKASPFFFFPKHFSFANVTVPELTRVQYL